jgi:hypothetical protein
MIQEPNNTLLKNGKEISKIYFTLLKKKAYPKKIDKLLYGEKSQRSHIYDHLKDLEIAGYVERIKPFSEKERIKEKYWVSTYKPLFEYFDLYADKRKKTSLSDEDRKLTNEELDILRNVLNSKWFSRFFEDKYLKSKCGKYVTQKNGNYISDCPLKFLAFVFEEVCSIRSSLEGIINFKIDNKEYFTKDFDSIISENKKLITNELKTKINKIKKKALIELGSHKNTKTIIDICMEGQGFMFIPYSIASKLKYVGRGGSTIYTSFHDAIEIVNREIDGKINSS